MTLDARYYLGVKANKVRFQHKQHLGGGDGGGHAAVRDHYDDIQEDLHVRDHGMSMSGGPVGGVGQSTAAEATFFTAFEDPDVGAECIGMVSLVPEQPQPSANINGDIRRGTLSTATCLDWASSWTTRSKVTCLEVNQNLHSGTIAASGGEGVGGIGGGCEVWAGTVQGDVCRIRTTSMSSASTTSTAMDEDFDQEGGERGTNNQFESHEGVHDGVVSGIDVNPQSGEVLSAGYDGSVYIHSSSSGGGGSVPRLHHTSGGAVSYTCVKWCSSVDVFLTGGTNMQLQTWDRRSKEMKQSMDMKELNTTTTTAMSSAPHVMGNQMILCVDVHPSRPHVCATGHEDGLVCVWDLRKENKPVSYNHLLQTEENNIINNNNMNGRKRKGFGHVWEVKFAQQEQLRMFGDLLNDTSGGHNGHVDWQSPVVPPVFACTQDGILGCTTSSKEGTTDGGCLRTLLMEGGGAIESFDVYEDSFAYVVKEGLVYIKDNKYSAV